ASARRRSRARWSAFPRLRASEEGTLQARWGLSAQMLERALGGHAAPRRAREIALHQEVRLVHVLERIGALAGSGGEGLEAYRTAAELVDQRDEDLPIHGVQSGGVHLQPLQRPVGDRPGDGAISL